MTKLKILLLGSGGREHAFAWKLAQSKRCEKLYIAPGNGGTSLCGENVAIAADDFPKIEQFVLGNNIGMVVVGPEDPLVKGIADYFLAKEALKKIPVIGPVQAGAQLEGSKAFSKKFMLRHNIPTAAYGEFNAGNLSEGKQFIDNMEPPIVLKADGLAAGKGVIISPTKEEAKATLDEMIGGMFGAASKTVVIEQFLKGIEFSVFALTDGKNYKLLPAAKDYKRIGDGDTGLNTGGMGAVSPVPFVDEALMQKVESLIIKPTMNGLQKDGIHYKGFLYFGLMNVQGEPFVIEYNTRMGDPETEVVIPRIKNDLVDLFEAVGNENLKDVTLEIDARACVTVVVASGGYPGSFEKGKKISGTDAVKESMVFHAGTKTENNETVTSGGRVLAVSSFGKDFKEAVKVSYASIDKISFEGMYCRKDIGFDL
ncbi:MAG: phosphoribosylamine--glycine ligase [Chitinophagales bacterium]|nr:phosphoribosylamine--glycine ligase [Chitinophagales bacterium]